MNTKGFNEETLIVLPIAVGNKYIFTIEEALAYMIGEDRVYYLEDILFHNVPVRDAIRSNGIRAVVDTLLEYAHDNEKVTARLDEIVGKYGEKPLADFGYCPQKCVRKRRKKRPTLACQPKSL